MLTSNQRTLGYLALACTLTLLMGCRDDADPAPTTPVAEAEALDPTPEAAPAEAEGAAAKVHGGTPTGGMNLPPGHPPIGHLTTKDAQGDDSADATEATAPARAAPPDPLSAKGPGSQTELDRVIKQLTAAGADPATVERVERAFTLAFHSVRKQRDYVGAKQLMMPLRKHPSTAAAANRILAYVAVNSGFDESAALYHYLQAVEADERYGEAHFGLALMYTRSDQNKARFHYQRAITLGVKDVKMLGERFHLTPKTE